MEDNWLKVGDFGDKSAVCVRAWSRSKSWTPIQPPDIQQIIVGKFDQLIRWASTAVEREKKSVKVELICKNDKGEEITLLSLTLELHQEGFSFRGTFVKLSIQ